MLALHNLIYFDVPIHTAAPWLWLGTAGLWLLMLLRRQVLPSLRAFPLTLFLAAEMGGSAPTQILQQNHLPLPDVQSASGQAAIRAAVNKLMNG